MAFREMFARYSGGKAIGNSEQAIGKNPFVMFTEFVNVDGILHPEGFERLKIDLEYTEAQRPMVGQIWGRDPEKFYEAAKLLAKLGFDGVDINMGCPQDKEVGQKTCAALILEPKHAQEIILATKKGAGDLPVSVKTRLGYNSLEEMQGWVENLLQTNIVALTLHGRTKREMSKVPAHWEKIAEAVKIRNALKSQALIIGNGDIKSHQEGLDRIAQTGCDGVMVARGAFGSPWFFTNHRPDIKERLRVMLEHAELFDKLLGKIKPFMIMRKHFKAYASGFDGAAELRAKLMETKNLDETKVIAEEYLKTIT